MSNEQTTGWPPSPSPREMINWLAFFVAPQCKDQRNIAMLMAVRDAVVQHFGISRAPSVGETRDHVADAVERANGP